MGATGMAPPPEDMRMWDNRAAANAYADLLLLTAAIDKLTSEMIEHLDGGPGGGYGPRIYLAFWRKKAVLRMARSLRAEARLIGSSAMRPT